MPGLHSIHSVDSLKLLEGLFERLDSVAFDCLEFFLQVNTSGEEQKGGFVGYDELSKAANLCLKNASAKLRLPDWRPWEKYVRMMSLVMREVVLKPWPPTRGGLAHDFDLQDLKLSMGMSRDYPVALEEGADFIRIGSAIFRPEEQRGVET